MPNFDYRIPNSNHRSLEDDLKHQLPNDNYNTPQPYPDMSHDQSRIIQARPEPAYDTTPSWNTNLPYDGEPSRREYLTEPQQVEPYDIPEEQPRQQTSMRDAVEFFNEQSGRFREDFRRDALLELLGDLIPDKPVSLEFFEERRSDGDLELLKDAAVHHKLRKDGMIEDLSSLYFLKDRRR